MVNKAPNLAKAAPIIGGLAAMSIEDRRFLAYGGGKAAIKREKAENNAR